MAKIVTKGRPAVDNTEFLLFENKWFYLIFFLYILLKVGDVVSIMTNISSGQLMSYSQDLVVERYENDSSMSLIERLTTILFIASGTLAANIKNKNIVLYSCILLMALIESVALARLGVLLAFVSCMIEISYRQNHLTEKKGFLKVLLSYSRIGFILLVIFGFSAYFRVASKDGALDIVIYKLGVYTIAMYEALLIWMRDNSHIYFTGYGTNTLAGIYKLVGINYEQGFFTPVETTYGPTNIYTNIRSFLTDFGVIGTALIFMAFGFVFNVIGRIKLTRINYMFSRVLVLVFVFCLISPFAYVNIMVAYILGGVLTICFCALGRQNTKTNCS